MNKKFKLIILLVFILHSPLIYADTIDWYVDPGATGAGDGTSPEDAYTSLDAFMDNEATDLVTATNNYVVHLSATGGADDTTAVLIDNGAWTLNATYDLRIVGDATGVWDDSKYVLHNNDTSTYAITCEEDYVTFENFQVKVTGSSVTKSAIGCFYQNASNKLIFDSLILKGVMSGVGGGVGILLNDGDIVAHLHNLLIYDFAITNDSGFKGIYCDAVSTANIYNCTIENCTVGIEQDDGTVNVINCIIANNYSGWGLDGTFNQYRYLCDDDDDDDGSSTNQDPSGGAWTNEFTDLDGEDYSLKNANCVGNGTDDPGGANQPDDDIAGNARTSTWDIGAFEYDDSGGSGNPSGNSGFVKLGWKGAGKSTGKQN